MQAMKARVKNGHIVVDKPTELPEGTELPIPVDEVERQFGLRSYAACRPS
jgi:hypothetical protein